MQLEFGGGETPRQPTYTQVDVRKMNDDTIVCNAWDITKHVHPDTVTDIYSRHFFEHLTHEQAQRTLDAWYTICQKGAKIVLLCPNMNMHLWQWVNWDKLTEKEKAHCRAGFWGWQREADESAWDLHKSGYDYPKLKELVTAHGFVNVQHTMPDGPFDKHLAVDFFK
jgi:predicted SAM-dependent methyltransferase